MFKKFNLFIVLIIFCSIPANAQDCAKFNKLSTEFAKCNSDLIKKKTSEKLKEGKKKFETSKLKDTLIKFKNSKNHKEFMEKMKNDN